MRSAWQLLVLCVAAALGLALGALLWAGDDSAPMTPPSRANSAIGRAQSQAPKPSAVDGDLYVLEAGRAWVRTISHGKWELSLVRPRVLWFADRPVRASGTVAPRKLAAIWQRAFAGEPPNGALVAPDAPDGPRPTALIVSPPRLSNGTISFRITADDGTSSASIAWLSRLTRDHSTANGGMAFFVDEGGEELDQLLVQGPYGLVWNQEESECAGYGSTTEVGAGFWVVFEDIDSGKCFFKPTYARFDVLDEKGTKVGTATFGGDPGDVWCTSALDCSSEESGRGSGFDDWFYYVEYHGEQGNP